MCGITGYYLNSSLTNNRPNLQRMMGLLAHRGPNDEGFYQDTHVGLGMRRLSIIDLETGHQPIVNETGTVHVVFNGEIYNYRELRTILQKDGHTFTTQSDTEILVHGYEKWGKDLPQKLRGMFAFAVWDSAKQRLFLARDHFGIKPLYYSQVNGTLSFASEIKSLLTNPSISRELDFEAVDQYLSFLYIPEPRTIFHGIRALPPAHYLICEKGNTRLQCYWEFKPEPNGYASPQEAMEDIREAFEDSVKAMLVSDVPLGLFLSGGMDSASILAMMVRHVDGPVRTFTIGFGNREKHWGELEAARRVASFFKTDHHEFQVEPDIVNLLPQMIHHFDQPFANPTALILYLLAGQTKNYVTVALAGTGGDEMFAGYPRYKGMVYYQHYQHLPAWLRKSNATLAGIALRDSANGQLWPQRIRRFLEGGASSFSDCYLSLLTVLDQRRKRRMYTPEFEEALASSDTMDFIRPYLKFENGIPSLERMMLADVNTYLPFNQLAYGDRMSMAQSLEIRVPFVDQKLTQVTSGIPLQWKMQGGVTKGLFREAMASYLPKEVLKAPKRGLNLPIALWFREDLRSWVRSLLSPERLKSRGYLRPEEVEKLLTEHESGRRDHSLFIWALIVLELWHQQYMD